METRNRVEEIASYETGVTANPEVDTEAYGLTRTSLLQEIADREAADRRAEESSTATMPIDSEMNIAEMNSGGNEETGEKGYTGFQVGETEDSTTGTEPESSQSGDSMNNGEMSTGGNE